MDVYLRVAGLFTRGSILLPKPLTIPLFPGALGSSVRCVNMASWVNVGSCKVRHVQIACIRFKAL